MSEPNNMLIIHCDQLRFDCLGFNGNPYVKTPNIDRLAQESTNFTRHIASNTICMPSRATLLSGLYPPGHNVWSNGVPLPRKEYVKPQVKPECFKWENFPDHSCREIPTIADVLKDSGYDTYALGKLHLTPNLSNPEDPFPEGWERWKQGLMKDWTGPYYGFDTYEMTCGHGEELPFFGHYAEWLKENFPDVHQAATKNCLNPDYPIKGNTDLYASVIPMETHNTQWIADRFENYLNGLGDRPFFAFVGFPDPHHPFTPSPEAYEMFKDAEVRESIDPEGAGLSGTLAKELAKDISGCSDEERKEFIRTTYAMIYQIDQAVGKMIAALKARGLWDTTTLVFTSDHGDFLCDHGLLCKASFASDNLLHLPCLIRVPDRAAAVDSSTTSNCDIMPTLLALAGIRAIKGLHGSNMFNSDASDAFAFCHTGNEEHGNYTVYTDQYRLTYFPNNNRLGELFDHHLDPGETTNLYWQPATRTIRDDLIQRIREKHLEIHNPIHAKFSVS